MSVLGPGERPPAATKPKKKARRKPVVQAPAGDIASSGGDYGTTEAKKYEKKRAFRKAVRDTYKEQPQRAKLAQAAKKTPGPAAKAIVHEHASRIARKLELAKSKNLHDIVSPEDLKAASAFRETAEFKKAISDAAYHGAEARGLSMSQAAAAASRAQEELQSTKALSRYQTDPLKIAGIAAFQTARATVEDPEHVIPKTAGGLGKMIIGAPAGVADLALNPSRIPEVPSLVAEDFKRRYGPLAKGDTKAFRERIKKEGAAPELADAASILAGPVSAGGKSLVKVAERGGLGKSAERLVTKPRATQRVSGNITHTPQRSDKPTRILAGKATDRVRAHVTARRARRATAPAHVREAVDQGEVTPILEKTPVIGRRSRARKAAARDKSIAHQQRRAETEREVNQGAEKNLGRLKPQERNAFKYALQLGLRGDDPRAAVHALERRKVQVAHERDANPDIEIIPGEDELVTIDNLIANADKAFTPRLAAVVREERERGKRLAEKDPGLTDEQAALRRTDPQAEFLGIKREGTLTDEALSTAKTELKQAKKARKRSGKAVTRQERNAGKTQGKAELHVARADRVTANQIARAERSVAIAEKSAANHDRRASAAKREDTRTAHTANAHAAAERADASRARLSVLERQIDRKPVRPLAAAERNEAEALRRQLDAAEAERAVAQAKGNVKKAKRAKRKGERLVDAEPAEQFVARVRSEAERQGLDEPGYHPSQKRPESVFGAFTTGGKKRAPLDREYEGALFRTGRESNDPRVYTTALAKNIKRKYNWNMVAKTFDDNAYSWSKDKSLNQIKDELRTRGIDPDSVAFWNPQIFRQARDKIERADEHSDLVHGETLGDTHVHAAAQQAAIDWDRLATSREEFNLKGGWSVIPKEVYDEIMADTHPSGFLGRGYDVLKGKASRLLLGNPVWLQFQVAGNAFLTGISGTGPVDVVKAQRWWSKLSPDERDAIEPYIGVQAFHDEQTRLGATSTNRLVNAYRAFKTTGFYKVAHKANPLDAIFKADNKQNNLFRRAVLYNSVKKAAYKRMGENVGLAQKAQNRMAGILSLGPDEAMREIINNRSLFEAHAKHVNDFLGDYTTYTARERRVLGRGVMFYGFMRFSLRFMFYTMPAKHPLTAAVMLKLGQLHHDELVRIFGIEPPPWELGAYYSPDGKFKIDIQRANPFFNTGQYIDLDTGSLKVNQAIGLVPPFAQALANQVAGKNVFLNKNWQVGGSTTETRAVSNSDRSKIFLADFLKGWGVAYSTAAKLDPKLRGKQGADSSLIFPEPIKYERSNAKRRNQKRVDRESKPALSILKDAIQPVHEGEGPIISAREYEAQTKKKKKASKGKAGTGVSVGSRGTGVLGISTGNDNLGVRP